MNYPKILLAQLNNLGDCLLGTTVARQIKNDYPEAHLTWAIGSCCKHIIDNNPYVDEIWEIPLTTINEESVIKAWAYFEKELENRKRNGDFDLVFLTQYTYGRFDNYMGLTRRSIFAGYPKSISVPIAPVIQLRENEIQNVKKIAAYNQLQEYKKVVLFECVAGSGQSFITEEFITHFCQIVSANNPDTCIILSSNKKRETTSKNIVDGSTLTFRENAELTKYCHLFIGISSGITWLCTSDWAKNLPKVILLDKNSPVASVVLDHTFFSIKGEPVFEINHCTPLQLSEIIHQPLIIQSAPNYRQLIKLWFCYPLRRLIKTSSIKEKLKMLKALIKNLIMMLKTIFTN